MACVLGSDGSLTRLCSAPHRGHVGYSISQAPLMCDAHHITLLGPNTLGT